MKAHLYPWFRSLCALVMLVGVSAFSAPETPCFTEDEQATLEKNLAEFKAITQNPFSKTKDSSAYQWDPIFMAPYYSEFRFGTSSFLGVPMDSDAVRWNFSKDGKEWDAQKARYKLLMSSLQMLLGQESRIANCAKAPLEAFKKVLLSERGGKPLEDCRRSFYEGITDYHRVLGNEILYAEDVIRAAAHKKMALTKEVSLVTIEGRKTAPHFESGIEGAMSYPKGETNVRRDTDEMFQGDLRNRYLPNEKKIYYVFPEFSATATRKDRGEIVQLLSFPMVGPLKQFATKRFEALANVETAGVLDKEGVDEKNALELVLKGVWRNYEVDHVTVNVRSYFSATGQLKNSQVSASPTIHEDRKASYAFDLVLPDDVFTDRLRLKVGGLFFHVLPNVVTTDDNRFDGIYLGADQLPLPKAYQFDRSEE